jgi:hypothetical protein
MNKVSLMILVFVSGFVFSTPSLAASADVAAALELFKQSHADQCQKKKIQVQLLLAHQSHDQEKLNKLEPELAAINKRLKPTEDKLNVIKANMNKNPDDKSAYETALLELGDCE